MYNQPIIFRGQWNSRSHLKTLVNFKVICSYQSGRKRKPEQTGTTTKYRTSKSTKDIFFNHRKQKTCDATHIQWQWLMDITFNHIESLSFSLICVKKNNKQYYCNAIPHVNWGFCFHYNHAVQWCAAVSSSSLLIAMNDSIKSFLTVSLTVAKIWISWTH